MQLHGMGWDGTKNFLKSSRPMGRKYFKEWSRPMGRKILKSGPVPWDEFFLIRPMGPFFSSRPVPRGALFRTDTDELPFIDPILTI